MTKQSKSCVNIKTALIPSVNSFVSVFAMKVLRLHRLISAAVDLVSIFAYPLKSHRRKPDARQSSLWKIHRRL
nr:MAG TPA: hypothetical protein [Bacteriophage sp.]